MVDPSPNLVCVDAIPEDTESVFGPASSKGRYSPVESCGYEPCYHWDLVSSQHRFEVSAYLMVTHFCQGIGISKSLVGCYPCLWSRKSSSLETYVPNCCRQNGCRESFAEREEVISASRGQFSEMRYSFDSFYQFPV